MRINYALLKGEFVLTGVAQWVRHHPANARIAGSIPSQGTHLDCRPGPQLGVSERQPHTMILSLSFSLPYPPSKNKFKKSFLKILYRYIYIF